MKPSPTTAGAALWVALLAALEVLAVEPTAYDVAKLHVLLLGDAAASPEAKADAGRAIIQLGQGALPVLIAHLDDDRVFEALRDVQNRNSLPPHLPPPPPILVDITVGARCRELLLDIITPAASSLPARPFKVFSTSILRVDDWNRWWRHNRHRSLAQIHARLRPLVDAYWAQHGTEQRVPIEPCHIIRKMTVPHCARGPQSCEKCAAAATERFVLLDICPEGESARPLVSTVVDGATRHFTYEVAGSFRDADEARRHAATHGIDDIEID